MICFMCGLDSRSVKLTQMKVFTGKGKGGGETNVTVCEHCKALAIQSNHPLNQNLSNEGGEQQGFIKPSKDNENVTYPPVRPMDE